MYLFDTNGRFVKLDLESMNLMYLWHLGWTAEWANEKLPLPKNEIGSGATVLWPTYDKLNHRILAVVDASDPPGRATETMDWKIVVLDAFSMSVIKVFDEPGQDASEPRIIVSNTQPEIWVAYAVYPSNVPASGRPEYFVVAYNSESLNEIRRFTRLTKTTPSGRQEAAEAWLSEPAYFSTQSNTIYRGGERTEFGDGELRQTIADDREWLTAQQRQELEALNKAYFAFPAAAGRSSKSGKSLRRTYGGDRSRFVWWTADFESKSTSPLFYSSPATGELSPDGSTVVLWETPSGEPVSRNQLAYTGRVQWFDVNSGELQVEKHLEEVKGTNHSSFPICLSTDARYVVQYSDPNVYVIDKDREEVYSLDISPQVTRQWTGCVFTEK